MRSALSPGSAASLAFTAAVMPASLTALLALSMARRVSALASLAADFASAFISLPFFSASAIAPSIFWPTVGSLAGGVFGWHAVRLIAANTLSATVEWTASWCRFMMRDPGLGCAEWAGCRARRAFDWHSQRYASRAGCDIG